MRKSQNRIDQEEIQRLTNQVEHQSKQVEQLLLIVAGSAAMDQKGLLQRQRDDETFQQTFHKEVMSALHDIKAENKSLRQEVKTLRAEFEVFREIFRLPTKKKFWVGVVIILSILVLLSRWTNDAYHLIWNAILKYFNKNFIA